MFDSIFQEYLADGTITEEEYSLVYQSGCHLAVEEGFLTITPPPVAAHYDARLSDDPHANHLATDPVGYAAYHQYVAAESVLHRVNARI